MNDYTVVWPLWWIEGSQVRPEEIELSEDLRQRLREWAAHFNEHFDPLSGWDTPEHASAHGAAAERLVEDLRAELGPDAEVRPDLWELKAD